MTYRRDGVAKEGNGGTEGSGFTLRAIVLGVLLSITMLAANMYLGLKAGMTISANIPCSVIAIIVFGTILRSRSISEVNVAQATGSVGEGMAAGIIFLFPSLVMSGAFVDYSQWGLKEYGTVTLAVLAGSVLGVIGMVGGFFSRKANQRNLAGMVELFNALKPEVQKIASDKDLEAFIQQYAPVDSPFGKALKDMHAKLKATKKAA